MLAFFSGFWLAGTSLCGLTVFALGRYEPKWSPTLNFAVDSLGLLLVGAFATAAFALSVALNEYPSARPGRAFLSGFLLAPIFMLATYLSRNLEYDLLAHAINWGTLLAGAVVSSTLAHPSATRGAEP